LRGSSAIRFGALAALAAAVGVALTLLAPEPGGSPKRFALARRPVTHGAARAALIRSVRRITIGHSVRGRRLDAFEIASPAAARSILVVGCIHGNEPAGIAIARRLLAATPPPAIALWLVPDLNPDGVTADMRVNANEVDLNRNFPWHWRPLGAPGDFQYSGPRPLSEPEARAARALILRVRPHISIWFHQPRGLVDLSGGDPRIERRFARLVGLPVRRLTRYPGSAVSWSNSILPGSTAFVVELPPGSLSSAAVNRYARAALTLAGQLASA
jgi:protein MpaA